MSSCDNCGVEGRYGILSPLAAFFVLLSVACFFGGLWWFGRLSTARYRKLAEAVCDDSSWKLSHNYWNGQTILRGSIHGTAFWFSNDSREMGLRSTIFVPAYVHHAFTLTMIHRETLPPEWSDTLAPIFEEAGIILLNAEAGYRQYVPVEIDTSDILVNQGLAREILQPLFDAKAPGISLTIMTQHPFQSEALKMEVDVLSKLVPIVMAGPPVLKKPTTEVLQPFSKSSTH